MTVHVRSNHMSRKIIFLKRRIREGDDVKIDNEIGSSFADELNTIGLALKTWLSYKVEPNNCMIKKSTNDSVHHLNFIPVQNLTGVCVTNTQKDHD